MTGIPTAREIARGYRRRGWAPIPVPHASKRPGYDGWQKLRLTDDQIDARFAADPMNVSVLPGTPSGGLADVDLDAALAVALADRFLPPTGAVFGRASARRSHRLYHITGAAKTASWGDPTVETDGPERGMLLEFRFSGHTLFPGSTHPSGEAIAWDAEGEPLAIAADELLPRLARLAAAVLLARHWPGRGTRHKAALALAGALLRAGWTPEDVEVFLRAVADGAGDEEAEDRVKAVASSAETLASGDPATGWPTLAGLVDPRVVRAATGWLGITMANPSSDSYEVFDAASADPDAAARSIPVPPFPLHVFPPRVRAYVRRGARSVGCPPDLVAVPFLAYAASAIGKTRLLAIKLRWRQRATLWTGVVAASGDGKSPGDGYARAPLDELQAEADERFEAQLAEYKKELGRWKAADPERRGDEPSQPVYEHWYSTDATVESLAPMLHKTAGLALACDELVAWARGCNAYKKGGNDRQKYLEIWNGRPLKVDRKTQGVLFVKEPVLCISGGIQPARLGELTRDASAHDGLLQRFLWCYPDVVPADWSWDESEIDDLPWMAGFFRSLRRAGPSGPLALPPEPAAKGLWKTWYDETLRRRRTLPPLAREFASKAPAQLARLWLLLETLWDPDAASPVASAARLRDAIDLMAYFEAHARRLLVHFGTATAAAETGVAARARAALERRGGWLSRTELWAALGRNGTAEELDAALAALLAAGAIEAREVATGTKIRTEYRTSVADASYEFDEEFDWEEDEEPAGPHRSNSSYEEFATTFHEEPARCYACKGTRFTAHGVCLTCHPRPGGTGTEAA